MATAGVPSPNAGGHPQARRPGKVHTHVYLKWITAFETGSIEVDLLHRQLVQEYNGLLRLTESGAPWPVIAAGASSLVEDCVRHFRVEEALLTRTGFPRHAEHAAEHQRLEHTMRDVLRHMECVDGSRDEHREVPRSLGPTLVDIIVRHDLDFRSHLLLRQGG